MKNTKLFTCGGNLVIDTTCLIAVMPISDPVIHGFPGQTLHLSRRYLNLRLCNPVSSRSALIRDLALSNIEWLRRKWRKWGLTGS
jgi:hypothetical protein